MNKFVYELFGDAPFRFDRESLTKDTHEKGDPSNGGGIVILVTGLVTVGDSPPCAFVQNFYLATAPATEGKKKQKNFFVLNDTFRLLGPIPAALTAATPALEKAAASVPTASSGPSDAAAAAEKATATTASSAPRGPSATASPSTEDAVPAAQQAAPVAASEAGPASAEPAAEPELEPKGPLSFSAMLKKGLSSSSGAAMTPGVVSTASAGPSSASAENGTAGGDVGDAKVNAAKPLPVSIYVKGLPAGTTEAKLRELFVDCGEIKKVDIKEERNFAFIDFGSEDNCAAVFARKSPWTLEGTVLSVEGRISKEYAKGGQFIGKGAGKGKPRYGGYTNGKGAKGDFDGGGKGNGKGNKSSGRGSGGKGGRKAAWTANASE